MATAELNTAYTDNELEYLPEPTDAELNEEQNRVSAPCDAPSADVTRNQLTAAYLLYHGLEGDI